MNLISTFALIATCCVIFIPSVYGQETEQQPRLNLVSFGLLPTSPEAAATQGYKPVELPSGASIERAKDLSFLFPPAGHQGYRQGSCVAWALAYGLSTYLESVSNQKDPSRLENQASPAWVFNQLAGGNCKNGVFISDAAQIIDRIGIASLKDYPYNPDDCSPRPSSANIKERAKKRKFSYLKYINEYKNPNVIKSLLSNGTPVLVGIYADKDFQKSNNSEYYPVFSGRLDPETYHAVVVIGYDDDRGSFLIQNSWGQEWGIDGRIWASYQAYVGMVGEAWIAGPKIKSQNTDAVVAWKGARIDTQNNEEDAIIIVNFEGNINSAQNQTVQIDIEFQDEDGNPILMNPQYPAYKNNLGYLAKSLEIKPPSNKYELSTYGVSIPWEAIPITTLRKTNKEIRIRVLTRIFVSYERKFEGVSEVFSLKIP